MGNCWINFKRPGVDAAFDMTNVTESGIEEDLERFCATTAGLAMDDGFGTAIEFIESPGKFPEGDHD